MPTSRPDAKLVFSCDLSVEASTAPCQELGQTSRRVNALFQRYRVPATWAVSGSDALHLLRSNGCEAGPAEVSLLITQAVTKADPVTVSRTIIARLNEVQQGASETPSNVVAFSGVDGTEHSALLGRQGIKGVRGGGAGVGCTNGGRRLSHGVWYEPPRVTLPAVGILRRYTACPVRHTLRTFDAVAHYGGTAHIRIDVNGIAGLNDKVIESLEKVILSAASLRDSSRLDVVTLTQSIQQHRQQARPARSIMRAA